MKDDDEPDEGEDEALLAELVAALGDELKHTGHASIDAAMRRHPHLAGELRSLWTAMVLSERVAGFERAAGSSVRGAGGSSGAQQRSTGALHADELHAAEFQAGEANAVGSDASPGEMGTPALPRLRLPARLGDYELLAELGRGGMGVVYKARQTSLGRMVAVKMILRGLMASSADLARFQAEAQSAARLDHPNIVPVYEVGALDEQPYFTMKYVSGTTLARRLDEGPLPPREAARVLAQVCRAVHFAHERGVLHRDLKPSNILLDRHGDAHVTDFGLAKRITSDTQLTASGAILGSPCHMAPEQAAGARGQLGPASDVYSLGTILYQMLTGRPPLQGASPVETVLLVLEQEPVPPRLLNPRADRQLEMIALKCLQKPPDLRYSSALALAQDLEAYLHDEPVAAASGLFTQVLARWFRETHHATVLEHWGLLWMWHSLVLLVMCLVTNWLALRGETARLPYMAIWIAGLSTWAGIFWALRRRAGPVTFIERQIAHVWAAAVAATALLFLVEALLDLPVLTLSPILGLISGMVFLVKAGMLTGKFYAQAVALFATSAAMAWLERNEIPYGITLFGCVSAVAFFVPGLKHYRQRRAALGE